jgi:ankyrin repeat protein
VDKTAVDESTPLGIAAYFGNQEVVEVGNAQLEMEDYDGLTALHCAAQEDELEPAKYLVARGCSLTAQTNNGQTALDLATQHNHPQLVQFLTSASASNLTTTNDYSSLRSLCAPFSSPFLSLNIARQLRYTTILAARHARRIHDDLSLHTPLLPFLLRLALLPSADNRTPETESQVFRRVLTFVGTGFALPAVVPLQESAKSVGTKKARGE